MLLFLKYIYKKISITAVIHSYNVSIHYKLIIYFRIQNKNVSEFTRAPEYSFLQ